MLDHLEKFERSLSTKRTIAGDDLQALSQLQFAEGPLFILALMEAQLASPPKWATPGGESTLLNTGDLKALSPGGKHRAKAVRAANIMHACRQFTTAYTHVSELNRLKHLSQLDIRLVMMVLGRGAASDARWEAVGGERYSPGSDRWRAVLACARARSKPRCWARCAQSARRTPLWSTWWPTSGRP